jgi:hypothetical protein
MISRRIITACDQVAMLAPWRLAASNSSLVYHLTTTPNFSPDPEKRPAEGLHWTRDPETTPKGLYVTNIPNFWLPWGGPRPYAAEFEVPDELLKKFPPTRNYPEHLIPPEHFGDLKLHRVLPTPGLLREDGPRNPGHFSDPEYAMGQDFLTGEKFKTRRTPNGSMLDEDRQALKALWKKNYGTGPYRHSTDARDMLPADRRKYEKWYNSYWDKAFKEDDDY